MTEKISRGVGGREEPVVGGTGSVFGKSSRVSDLGLLTEVPRAEAGASGAIELLSDD